MLRTTRRSIAATAMLVMALVISLALTAAPASAHSLNSAVRSSAGCGWPSGSYSILDQSAVTTSGSTLYGTVYLLWHGGSGENCVVTRKTGSTHGSSSYTAACLYRLGMSTVCDRYQYAHYAAVAAPASGVCVRFDGAIQHPVTVDVARGGRSNYGNCGS